MPCPKCSGLLVLSELYDDYSGLRCPSVRCLSCGLELDPVMEANRLLKQPSGSVADKRLSKRKFNHEIQSVSVKQ